MTARSHRPRARVAASLFAGFAAAVSMLPTADDVVDYFLWRQEDAHRNCLNGHAYWLLRGEGLSDDEATKRLRGVSVSGRNELLFSRGRNFADLPAWQRRGSAVRLRDGDEGRRHLAAFGEQHVPGAYRRSGIHCLEADAGRRQCLTHRPGGTREGLAGPIKQNVDA